MSQGPCVYQVVLVDSTELARIGCLSLFRGDPRFEVVAETAARDALVLHDIDADLLVIDPVIDDCLDTLLVRLS